tara:strand:- start:281 stop:1054 length:774 start_codon:yes stop_codon:yes gene_type:complete
MALAGGLDIATNTRTLLASHWVPLRFWFCNNPGNALPLIALQYHEVRIITNFSATLGAPSSTLADNLTMWANYIYLDTDERRRFAQVSHEYLIEQVQFQDSTAEDGSIILNFNHPVKELIWAGKSSTEWGTSASDSGTFADIGGSNTTFQLKLNGHNRFAPQDMGYFAAQQIWKYHSGYGGVSLTSGTGGLQYSIGVYSFALKPEEHQPSGTCNFSRIDNAELKIDGDTNTPGYYVYAVNYNVLRIMSGMGGLAYSN